MRKLAVYARLMRLDRPIGIFLLLWPTLWALSMASAGNPDWNIVAIFILGVVVMRSAGCVINDWADRHVDGHVARTKNRPLVTGEATPMEALLLFFILCSMAFGLVLSLNALTIRLAPIGLLLASLYPFTKRYTHWPQLILGTAFAWAIPMAFAAHNNHIPPVAWLLYVTTVLWVLVYDTLYAMVDREDDQKIGIKTTAILFGRYDRLILGSLQIIILGLLYLLHVHICALLAGTGLCLYQQYLIRHREPSRCFKAFLNNNWFGLVILLGFIAGR